MSQLPETARVVVIGGGAVGCSVLYHLGLAGWRDCVLLEKNELTSGSTWHAAGNCPNFAASWALMALQAYSTTLYRRLAADVDYPMNYHVTGSVRLAHHRERMREFEHVRSMAARIGVEMTTLTPSELQQHYPYLQTHDLAGGLWDPTDGDIDPAQLTQAFAKGARQLGQQIVRFAAVDAVERDGDGWRVVTEQGSIRCEIVVNAAGYRAAEIGRLFGRDVPCVAMAHQYLVTETIDELAARETKLPLLRDPDSSYYLRQEVNGLLLGPYEKHCRAHWRSDADPMPDDFSFQLYPDDLERLEWYIEDACARVPLLASAGITRVVNGPIPYAPDGLPLIGPMPGVANAYEACVFTFGIVQAGGAGKLCADWIVHGEPEHDSWALDPRRFTDFATPEYAEAKAIEVYSHEYAIHFPHIQWPAGRPAKTSPTYATLAAKDAEFGSYGGWERLDWLPADGDRRGQIDSYQRPAWFDTVGAECRHVAEHVGVVDLTGFSRYRVRGAGLADWLNGLVCGRLARPGRINLCYFATPAGKLLTEMSMVRFADDDCWLLTAAGARWHDRDWLQRHLPADGSVRLDDDSDRWASFLVTGPSSRALLEQLSGAALDFPWLSHRPFRIDDIDGQLLRVSFAGELGWELHVPIERGLELYRRLFDAGAAHRLRDFGMLALDSMRLEKAYRSWKGDLNADYTPLELGLQRWVDFDKTFIGRDALWRQQQRGVDRQIVMLTPSAAADDGTVEPLALASVFADDRPVGLVQSSGYGHRIGRSLALAVVENDYAAAGSELIVDHFGEPLAVTVQPQLVQYDADATRLRG